MLKKLLKEIFKQKWIYILFIVWIINQIFMVSLPSFWKIFIDFIDKKNIWDEFYFYLYLSIIISILAITFWTLTSYLKKWISTRFEILKNIYYFKKFFSLDFEHRSSEWTWKIITKINRGIEAQVSLFNTIIQAIFILWVRASIILVIIFNIYKSIVFILFIIWFLIFILAKIIGKKVKYLTTQEQDLSENIWKQTNKMIMESNLINISNKSEFEINNLKEIFSPLVKIRQKILLWNNITYDVMHILFQTIEFISYLVIWFMILKSEISIWDLFLIVSYIWWLWWPVSIIIDNATEYRNQISKYEALENFVNQENKIKDWEKSFEIKSWEINFKNVDFWYNGEMQIFKNFDLKISWWKTTALVWHSWSWKSTIIKLLLRNYIVNNWIIEIDWQDIKELKISSFYEKVWYLSQEPAVFDWTIRENLMYGMNVGNEYFHFEKEGNENIHSLQEKQNNLLWESLKKVDLYDLVKNSKDWLETYVWEKWIKLSWWERQRIALARIFISNPKILILDEPTSALDSISENKVTKIIDEMMKDKTVIVIAHRLQTVMHADNIIVLEKWKIIESWKHNELLLKWWIYSSLVDLQRWVITD